MVHRLVGLTSRYRTLLWRLESPDLGVFYLTRGQYSLGRGSENDLVVNADGVSRHHAQIDCDSDAVVLRDVGSTNGLRLNGDTVYGPVELLVGDRFALGDAATFELVSLELPTEESLLLVAAPNKGHWCLPPGEYIVGRDEDVDLVLDHEDVSRRHARIEFDGQHAILHDLSSSNGVFDATGRIDRATLNAIDVLWLGPCALFFSLSRPDFHLADVPSAEPMTARKSSPISPESAEGLPAAGWIFLVFVAFATIGGAIWYLGDFSAGDFRQPPRSAAEIERERQRQAQIARAHAAASTVAMDTQFRQRLRTLSTQTETIEATLRPIFDELDRVGDLLQEFTGNPITRRLLVGTELAPIADEVNRLVGTSRQFMADLRRMPQDLNALEQSLGRYQSRSSQQNLSALIAPSRRAVQQGERIERGVQTIETSLGSMANQFNRLADISRNWRVGSEISPTARRVAAELRGGQRALTDYRQTLARDLEQIRRLEQEAGAAARG